MNIFEILLVNPLINIMVALYQALIYLHIPGALGFSIVLSTVLFRLVLYPLTVSQIKTSQKMQQIQPHLNSLKDKHKSDPKRLQQEQMNLYKEHGINPAGGCLPFIIQIGILIFGFYPAIMKVINLKPVDTVRVINKIVYFDFLKLKHVWDTDFFGLSVGKTPSQLLSHYGYIIILLPVVTALLQLLLSIMTVPAKSSLPPVVVKPGEKQEPNFAQSFQSQMLLMTPLITGYFSFQLAVGLSLYWNTFTIFGIIQQYLVQGLGGLGDQLDKLKWKKQ